MYISKMYYIDTLIFAKIAVSEIQQIQNKNLDLHSTLTRKRETKQRKLSLSRPTYPHIFMFFPSILQEIIVRVTGLSEDTLYSSASRICSQAYFVGE